MFSNIIGSFQKERFPKLYKEGALSFWGFRTSGLLWWACHSAAVSCPPTAMAPRGADTRGSSIMWIIMVGKV